MNYGMELCLQSPNPRLINWGFNLGTLSSWDLGNMLMLLKKIQMMMGVPQTTMSKWQLNFFTFQSISGVLKSNISLSAFTVIIDHQREESIAKIHWIWFYKCLSDDGLLTKLVPADRVDIKCRICYYCRIGFPQNKWIIHLTHHHITWSTGAYNMMVMGKCSIKNHDLVPSLLFLRIPVVWCVILMTPVFR